MATSIYAVPFVLLHLLFVQFHHSLSLSPALFYADNGLDQTIAYKYLPTRERKEMQEEILNLLGLHHRPKPKSRSMTIILILIIILIVILIIILIMILIIICPFIL